MGKRENPVEVFIWSGRKKIYKPKRIVLAALSLQRLKSCLVSPRSHRRWSARTMSAKPRRPTSEYHCRSNIITANDAFFTKSIGTILSQFCNFANLQLPWANLGPWGKWRQPWLRGSTDTCSSGKVVTISVAISATIYSMFIVAVLSISNFIYNKNLNSICKAA